MSGLNFTYGFVVYLDNYEANLKPTITKNVVMHYSWLCL